MRSIDARPGIAGASGSGDGHRVVTDVPEAIVDRMVAADGTDRLRVRGSLLAIRQEKSFNGGPNLSDRLDRIS